MSLLFHAQEAAQRLAQALQSIDALQEEPESPEKLAHWLGALTEGLRALQDLQLFSDESLREELGTLTSSREE